MVKRKNDRPIALELLLALIPYTEQNCLLVFKPNQFFDALEKTSDYPRKRIRDEYHRAKRQMLFTLENNKVALSLRGRQMTQPFIAKKLSKGAKLMVIFDIPEENAGTRQKFRNLLKQLGFHQIQLSVWVSAMDHRAILSESIRQMEIEDWVKMYEAQETY